MLAMATMQRSDSDPHDTASMPVEVDPHWMLMRPFDPKTIVLPRAHKPTGAISCGPVRKSVIMGRP
jgi:hypothetical protein